MKKPERLLRPEEFKAALPYFPTRTSNSRKIARLFFVRGEPPSVIAAEMECSIPYVLKVIARFEAAHQSAQSGEELPKSESRKPEQILSRRQYNGTLKYFLTRQGNSQAIAYDFYVRGHAPSAIATAYDCRVQNVVKVIDRFAKAFDRYMEAERNTNPQLRAEDPDEMDAP